MKIIHLCLGDRFVDGHSYQVNYLVKFHKAMGLDVEIIASQDGFDKNGLDIHNLPAGMYVSDYGVKVTRIQYTHANSLIYKLKTYKGLIDALEEAHPNILFIHNCQFWDMRKVVRYLKKNPQVKVYVDNHADFSNSATNIISKVFLHGILWKHCAHIVEPYTTKFYGVLPARVDFLRDVYKLPSDKCELLVMGADDDLVKKAMDSERTAKLREECGISDNDFIIVSGGKIDRWKKQTLLLMDAVHNINKSDLKLILFGSVTPDLKAEVEQRVDGNQVKYIGWIDSAKSYDYFAIADLIVFPGRHSVFWEQAVAQGKPIVVKKWAGTTHVDLGGNVVFLEQDSVEEIQDVIERLYKNRDELSRMTNIAKEKGMKVFSYSNIAKHAIEMD